MSRVCSPSDPPSQRPPWGRWPIGAGLEVRAFKFDRNLIEAYSRFSRSFSRIRSVDLRTAVEEQYDAARFWPSALLSINPRFLKGPTVNDLVVSGDLDEATGKIFRIGTTPLRFYRHQSEAIAKARAGQSFVVTTGTGSGKSLCFFVPIVDAIVRERKAGRRRGTSAIIIYPMNALANSQIKEIQKFISQSGLPNDLRPAVRRYTGQESKEERERIAENPPDILLTNFMMAELLLTRQEGIDAKIIENASDLKFIVLDELHTYRGRQGPMLRFSFVVYAIAACPRGPRSASAPPPPWPARAPKAAVCKPSPTRLLACLERPSAPTPSLTSLSSVPRDDSLTVQDVKAQLADVLTSPLPDGLTDDVLKRHPLAVWTELSIGLDDGQELKRKKPIPFDKTVAIRRDVYVLGSVGLSGERPRNSGASLPDSAAIAFRDTCLAARCR